MKQYPRETVQFRRVEELGGLEVVRATYFHHRFPKHSHDVFAFGIVERGVQATDYRGATHTAVAGEICLVSPGEVHTGYGPDGQGWSYRCCYPDAQLTSEIARQGGSIDCIPPYFPSPVIHDPVVYDRFQRLFNAIDQCEDVMGLEEKLVAAISAVVSRHAERNAPLAGQNGSTGQVRRARDYIEEHWSDQLTLQDIASAAGVDRYCLIRSFRRYLGTTPHAYLMQKRIDRGRRLLLAGSSPAQAALDSGFFDQSHFTKQFKRFTGTTPGNCLGSLKQRRGGRAS